MAPGPHLLAEIQESQPLVHEAPRRTSLDNMKQSFQDGEMAAFLLVRSDMSRVRFDP